MSHGFGGTGHQDGLNHCGKCPSVGLAHPTITLAPSWGHPPCPGVSGWTSISDGAVFHADPTHTISTWACCSTTSLGMAPACFQAVCSHATHTPPPGPRQRGVLPRAGASGQAPVRLLHPLQPAGRRHAAGGAAARRLRAADGVALPAHVAALGHPGRAGGGGGRGGRGRGCAVGCAVGCSGLSKWRDGVRDYAWSGWNALRCICVM